MKIFVVNCGSSSIKYQIMDMENETPIVRGLVDRIGMEGASLRHTPAGKYTIDLPLELADHKAGIKAIMDALVHKDYGVIKDLSEIDAVGHRVVHGGERFTESAFITDAVLTSIRECAELAPLHNPPNLHGIQACMELMPNTPHVAVFDTAYHQSMPKEAYLYGLPYELYLKYGLRRYGFHGMSHKYVAGMAADMLEEHITNLRLVTCHLGNGASVAAVKYGKSIDTSMGFTPLEGLLMGTRSGDLDPAIIPFIMEREDMTPTQIEAYLNRRSGILGISGLSSDFRDLESAANRGDERSQLAIDIFAYKVKKYIGAYVAAMGGVDAIIFTAGVGENSIFMREKICMGLEYLGTRIDPERNKVRGKAQEISVKRATVKIFVIPTNEELVIARDTYNICKRIIRL